MGYTIEINIEYTWTRGKFLKGNINTWNVMYDSILFFKIRYIDKDMLHREDLTRYLNNFSIHIIMYVKILSKNKHLVV